MLPPIYISMLDFSQLRDLQVLLEKPVMMNRAIASRLRMLADSLEHCARLKETYQNRSGTPALEFSLSALMEKSLATSGQAGTTDTPPKKRKRGSKGLKRFRAQRRASNSIPSTLKSAKRVHTGGKSKVRSRSVDKFEKTRRRAKQKRK